MIPSPLKMLVCGTLADELIDQLPALFKPDSEFRHAPVADADDLTWANSYSGFDIPLELRTTHLQWVHCWGAGVEQWLGDRLSPDCLLTRTVGDMGRKMAEFCLAYSLGLNWDVFGVRDNQAQQLWKDRVSQSLPGKNVAVLGAGAIGAEIGRLFRACGAHVTGYGRSGSESVLKFEKFYEHAAQTDILIACLPSTPSTYHLIDADLLGKCRLQQFINVGRGDTVDTGALLDALDNGSVGHAVLDVFETEPLPPESPLWSADRLLVSPHRSAPTQAADIVDSLRQVLADAENSRLVVDRSRFY